jgi:hypothetical protein
MVAARFTSRLLVMKALLVVVLLLLLLLLLQRCPCLEEFSYRPRQEEDGVALME